MKYKFYEIILFLLSLWIGFSIMMGVMVIEITLLRVLDFSALPELGRFQSILALTGIFILTLYLPWILGVKLATKFYNFVISLKEDAKKNLNPKRGKTTSRRINRC